MGEALAKLVKLGDRQKRDQARDKQARQPGGRVWQERSSKEEAGALKRLQTEAKAHGVKLHNGGKGGLPSSLVLHVMRRDGYRCKKCGKNDSPLGVHHKAHLENPDSDWLKKKAKLTGDKKNDPNLLTAMCDNCHDSLHQEDRKNGNA